MNAASIDHNEVIIESPLRIRALLPGNMPKLDAET
jgi:hypothetical protein